MRTSKHATKEAEFRKRTTSASAAYLRGIEIFWGPFKLASIKAGDSQVIYSISGLYRAGNHPPPHSYIMQ